MAEEFHLGNGNWWDDRSSSSMPIETTHVDIKPRTFMGFRPVSKASNEGSDCNNDDSSSQAHEWNHQSLLRDENNSILSQGGLYIINPLNCEIDDNHQAFPRTSLPKQSSSSPQPHSQLHFSNNTPFWNASAAAMNDVSSSHFPSNLHNQQLLNPIIHEKAKIMGEIRDISRISKKISNETSNKRPRNDQSRSPSPAFKVRKEKMGDRITALQQLVSPFGKTDTASVLSEAIEYIKFLHNQIGALSDPYMKNGAPMQQQFGSNAAEGRSKDLRSRGLCLVPISSTFPVTHETTVELWTPTFGANFR